MNTDQNDILLGKIMDTDQELMEKMQELEGKIVLACEEVMEYPHWIRETVLFEAFKTIVKKHRKLGDTRNENTNS